MFSVHAVTNFGIGKNATTSVQYNWNFGQVNNLTASVGSNYTMTVQWKPPSNIDSREIKVCNVFVNLEVFTELD